MNDAVERCARKLLGVGDGDTRTEDTRAQLAWSPDLAGMGFFCAALSAYLGRLAAVVQCLPIAHEHLRWILPGATDATVAEAYSLHGVDETLVYFKSVYDIEIAASGEIAMGSEPRFGPYAEFQPLRCLMGIVTRAVSLKQRCVC